MDIGPDSGATGTIAFTFASTTSSARQWEIKVTQVPCYSPARQPDGCLQYHTGIAGRIETFNFQEPTTSSQQHLTDQNYNICIRQEEGYCCVRYTLCEDDRSWSLDNKAAAKSEVGTQCSD